MALREQQQRETQRFLHLRSNCDALSDELRRISRALQRMSPAEGVPSNAHISSPADSSAREAFLQSGKSAGGEAAMQSYDSERASVSVSVGPSALGSGRSGDSGPLREADLREACEAVTRHRRRWLEKQPPDLRQRGEALLERLRELQHKGEDKRNYLQFQRSQMEVVSQVLDAEDGTAGRGRQGQRPPSERAPELQGGGSAAAPGAARNSDSNGSARAAAADGHPASGRRRSLGGHTGSSQQRLAVG